MKNFSLAAKSFIINKNRLLILKRSSGDVQKPGIWEIPGGRLELGEDPFEGLKRETKEETGIDIEVLHPMSVRHFTRDDGQVITMIIFLCKALNEKVNIGKEHSAYEWVPIAKSKHKLGDFFHKEVDIFNELELQKLL